MNPKPNDEHNNNNNNEPVDIFENLLENIQEGATDSERLCKLEDNIILLFDGCSWYSIECSQCDTPQKALHWVYHLLTKPWVTTSHVKLFLSNAFCHIPHLAPAGSHGN